MAIMLKVYIFLGHTRADQGFEEFSYIETTLVLAERGQKRSKRLLSRV